MSLRLNTNPTKDNALFIAKTTTAHSAVGFYLAGNDVAVSISVKASEETSSEVLTTVRVNAQDFRKFCLEFLKAGIK